MRSVAAVVSAAALTLALSAATSAGAASQPPLNQYLVTNVSPKVLAAGGYDRTETGLPGHPGTFLVVATPAQANALRGKGATVKALHGVSKGRRTAPKASRGKALPNPTHGYNVFRPWSLQPAPCPGTCAIPNIPLKSWYHSMAIQYPRLVKEEVMARPRQGKDIIASKVPKDAREQRDAAAPPPSTTRPSTRASGSRPRSSGACSRGSSRTARALTSSAC